MNVKELILSIKDKNSISKRYFQLFSEYYKYDFPKNTNISTIEKIIINQIDKFIQKILKIDIENTFSESIIFVTKNKEIDCESKKIKEITYSFMCKKSDIMNNSPSGELSVWSSSDYRIEHYSFDMIPYKKILEQDIYFDIDEIDAICEIINHMTRLGFSEEIKRNNILKIEEELDKSLKNIDENEFLSAEEVFEKLEKNILEKMSDEEKQQHTIKKEKQKINNEIFDKYRKSIMHVNHMNCIMIIYKYYLSLFEKEPFV